MVGNGLNGFAVTAIEHEPAERLNEIDLVKDFADAKGRKTNFEHLTFHDVTICA